MPTEKPKGWNTRRQLEIYRAGLEGRTPPLPLDPLVLEQRAREVMDPAAFDFAAGGAGLGHTMRANLSAFDRWRILPRMFRDISTRDLSVEIFGQKFGAPLLIAPIGVQELYHPEGDVLSARAAASVGVPFCLSTVASRSIEEVAAAMGDATRWFQLYWSKDPGIAASFIHRAEAAGYSALVVTLDTVVLGWRDRDLQRAYLPFLHAKGIANFTSDPVFRASLARPPEEDLTAAAERYLEVFSNPALTWKDIAFLREHTRLPILLKGIQHPDDARLALDHGIDGLVVSNHGGRQVDGAVGSLEALPGIVEVVAEKIPVLFDSGIRRGSDAFKALALGARAVLLGRPYIYAMAVAGEEGVREVLLNFIAELDITLAASGHATVAGLTPADLLQV